MGGDDDIGLGAVTERYAMFHYGNNLFFGRRADDSVRIVQLRETQQEYPSADATLEGTLFDVTVDADSWGSIISSVSAKGEESGRWYEAMDFHHGRRITNPVECTFQVGLCCKECSKIVGVNGHLNVADVDGVTVLTAAWCSDCYEALGKAT